MMKKRIALFLSALLVLTLTGCSLSQLQGDDGADGGTSHSYGIGERAETYFFDFTVNDAYRTTELNGYYTEEGYQMLVVDITVQNTFQKEITMYDGDFQIQWGEGDEDYDYPVSSLKVDDLLPEEYDLDQGESRTGLLVFAVPEEAEAFDIAYLEQFSDDTTGDAYFVHFTAETKQPA